MRFRFVSLPAAVIVTAALLFAAAPVQAQVVVDYDAQGTFTTSSPITINGLTTTPGAGQTLSLAGGFGGLGLWAARPLLPS